MSPKPSRIQAILSFGDGKEYSPAELIKIAPSKGVAVPPHFDSPLDARAYLKKRLCLAIRIFAKFGFDEGIAGHITCRDPIEPNSMWVNPFGVAWALVMPEDLVRVDSKGIIQEAGRVKAVNNPANLIHWAIHEARPDVLCVAHSHSIHARSFSALGKPLAYYSLDACAFYNDLALFRSGGVVLNTDEGLEIAKALGKKKAVIMANHGIITVGSSIESAVFWFLSLEKCCKAQLIIESTMEVNSPNFVQIGEEDVIQTYETGGNELAGYISALPTFDVMAYETRKDISL